MWTWQITFYDPVSDRTFLITCPRFFWTPKEAEDDIVKCCEMGVFTQSGVPITARILTADAVFFHGHERYGNGQDD